MPEVLKPTAVNVAVPRLPSQPRAHMLTLVRCCRLLQALEVSKAQSGSICESQCLEMIAPQNATSRDYESEQPPAADYESAVDAAEADGRLKSCCGLGCKVRAHMCEHECLMVRGCSSCPKQRQWTEVNYAFKHKPLISSCSFLQNPLFERYKAVQRSCTGSSPDFAIPLEVYGNVVRCAHELACMHLNVHYTVGWCCTLPAFQSCCAAACVCMHSPRHGLQIC